ncbi:LacI family DNA-binding transcriptional regulator [Paracoccus subflavus]|uniref:LacI family DNA-binding transcriptional regulator n=1 Tax=Paracoccus subflavus TaxID=2528244 RepID=A0A4Q9G1E5_9RHOB|nr:LacI family DNA-binding transcriptional regulator [Paracoccus subflavus]TBN39955.1 LacI family DNA-binding transcriptional regulator [Paracoccus subflavus]
MVKKENLKPDIVSVAKLAGVSVATVSRVMNHPDLVQPSTRKKVEQAIRKCGYIRNRAAQTIHGRRSATIGLVVPTLAYTIFAELVQAFNDTVTDSGFTLLLASHGYDLAAEYQLVRKLLEHRVDALALIGLDHGQDTYRVLREQGVPVLAIWNYAANSEISCIGVDNAEAGRLAANHLLMLGHRSIGTVFPALEDNDRARARKSSAMDRFMSLDAELRPEWQRQTPYSIAEAKVACLDLLDRAERPTALLCGNDVIAQGAIFSALRLGLSVPRDVSIIGIGDFAGSAELEPGLTTVRIPANRIGTAAARQLIKAVDNAADGALLGTRFECELVMRGTTITARPG